MVEVGSTVGNYEVLAQIGEGSMGAVYLARHPVIGKRVALKVIRPQLAGDEEVVARFFNEARAVAQIGHPHIVEVQDFGQTPSGESFIVMELLEGTTLGALLRAQPWALEIDRAVQITAQLTDGLHAAHIRGIVHRDLKPENVFLVTRGADTQFVKILDFGLAKLTGPGGMAHKTRTGAVMGTAHYMAPEAAEDARKVDPRSDVYALGCILFEMVAGRVPFPGVGVGEVLVRQLREPPPLPSRLRADVPPWLEKLILHALAKKPEFRLASMAEFGRALRDPVAWEREFDDHELGDRELRGAVDRAPAVVSAPPEPRVRPQQISVDAKTLLGEAAPALVRAETSRPAQTERIAPTAARSPASWVLSGLVALLLAAGGIVSARRLLGPARTDDPTPTAVVTPVTPASPAPALPREVVPVPVEEPSPVRAPSTVSRGEMRGKHHGRAKRVVDPDKRLLSPSF